MQFLPPCRKCFGKSPKCFCWKSEKQFHKIYLQENYSSNCSSGNVTKTFLQTYQKFFAKRPTIFCSISQSTWEQKFPKKNISPETFLWTRSMPFWQLAENSSPKVKVQKNSAQCPKKMQNKKFSKRISSLEKFFWTHIEGRFADHLQIFFPEIGEKYAQSANFFGKKKFLKNLFFVPWSIPLHYSKLAVEYNWKEIQIRSHPKFFKSLTIIKGDENCCRILLIGLFPLILRFAKLCEIYESRKIENLMIFLHSYSFILLQSTLISFGVRKSSRRLSVVLFNISCQTTVLVSSFISSERKNCAIFKS